VAKHFLTVNNKETESISKKANYTRSPSPTCRPTPYQPRKVIDPQALDELTTSITQMGVVQPIVKTDIDNTIAAMAAPEPTTTDAPPAG